MTLARQDGDLGRFRLWRAIGEGQFGDQQGHREADPGQETDGRHVQPGQPLRQRGPGESGRQARTEQHTERLAHDEAQDHTDGHRRAERLDDTLAAQVHASGEEREDRHTEACREGVYAMLQTFRWCLEPPPDPP